MKPLSAAEIRGTYATLLLPVDPDESIHWDRLDSQLDSLAGSGVDGIYINGTAGEFWSLTDSEFKRLAHKLTEQCEKARIPFQIGASFSSPQISLERARWAAGLRPGAIQVILPDWWPPAAVETVAYLQTLAEAVHPVPLVLYNPPHAKHVLQPEDLVALCDRIPALVGVKTGGGDRSWFHRMRPLFGRLSIFVPGHSLATASTLGATGSYSNVACLQPAGAKRWWELMQRDIQAALEVEAQIQNFLNTHVLPFRDRRGFSNMALDKLLAFAGDWAPIGTRLRWPYSGIDEASAEPLKLQARRDIPYLFEERRAFSPDGT